MDPTSQPEPTPEYTTAARAAGLRLRQSAPVRRGPPPFELPILTYLKTHRTILASASPRRKALLAQLGLTNLEIRPSTKPEDLSKATHAPHEYVAATARQKCLHVYTTALEQAEAAEGGTTEATDDDDDDDDDPACVIAADTVVVTRAGAVLEKPRSAADHGRMLRHLRDARAHRVLTSVCVLAPRADAAHPGYAIAAETAETTVVFAREEDGLTDEVIDAYVATREGADKAGGYALQGVGGLMLVERVEGAVDNVVGLPVRMCLRLCERVCFMQGEEEVGEGSSEED